MLEVFLARSLIQRICLACSVVVIASIAMALDDERET